MLVTYVVAAVIGFIIYTVLKIMIEEWLDETTMKRFKPKKMKAKNEDPQANSLSPTIPIETIEISSDDSNISFNHKETDNYATFQKSTDSIQSDEDVEEPVFGSSSGTNVPLFNWTPQIKSSSRSNVRKQDSFDSSDDSNDGSKWFRKRQEKKKVKTERDIEETSINESSKEDATPQVAINHDLIVSGVNVKLPVKPYSCQIAVMSKLVHGCVKQENCLLESPTGSGKTLALLCGVLAWHDHYIAEIQKKMSAAVFGGGDCESRRSGESSGQDFPREEKFADFFDDAKNDDFEDMLDGKKTKSKIPKIYYGTRTHKQIEQVVRELRKTCYKHKKMTILSSREHTCIQESTRNKTELCNDLLDPSKHKGCPYYNESSKKALSTFLIAEQRGLPVVWDVEDLVNVGKTNKCCPYFGARNLMEQADIIFCPYNYIIDPDIRESMQIDLKDHIIILDEAHNIEDICREVASVNYREDHLITAATECESLGKQRAADTSTYTTLQQFILKLVAFLKIICLDNVDYRTNDKSSTYWSGEEIVELCDMHDLGESAYTAFAAASSAAIADCNKAKDESRMYPKLAKPVISPSTKIVIEHLMFGMRMIRTPDFANDYRACVMETTVKDFKHAMEDTWYSTKKREQRIRTLKLICMNPGVTFSPIAHMARSIILASGTLTPTTSFQSELDTKFAHVLNTGHVIPREQVYATCVPRGPTGVHLKANYQNVNTWAFQDELGRVMLDVCETVPHGVLCFFSSYTVMHTHINRWKNNLIWNKITNVKEVFIEPRSSGDLAGIMKEYRHVIQKTSAGPMGNINGAMLLAVFRGKVAEGIDFRDDEARCVMTVGIPYAVRMDPVIDMKFKYNDMNVKKGLLKGSEWYNIQAYRALNQALGRCLRHIHDWGAVLLIDERFLQPQNKEHLSKWVKTMWVEQAGYNLRENLRNFVARQKAREEKK